MKKKIRQTGRTLQNQQGITYLYLFMAANIFFYQPYVVTYFRYRIFYIQLKKHFNWVAFVIATVLNKKLKIMSKYLVSFNVKDL